MTTEPAKRAQPSQFLRTLDPHVIYDAPELMMDFVKETGLCPSWPTHSAQRAQIDILAAGGGKPPKESWMNTSERLAPVCYGWEVAEAVAKSQLPNFAGLPRAEGRFIDMREAYEQAICALEEAGR